MKKLENLVTKKVVEMSVQMTKKFKDLPNLVTTCLIDQFSLLNCVKLQKFTNVIDFLNEIEIKVNKSNRDLTGPEGVFYKCKDLYDNFFKLDELLKAELEMIK